MGRALSACVIICVLLIIWAEKIYCPAVNTQPETNFCVLRTQKGVEIRASLKPSLNAKQNRHQTLDLNARCCSNPDKKCALTEHLNVTLNNITSLLKYPIHPLWMVVSNKRIPHLGVWDELWYSFYEFGKPSLTQTVDVEITSINSKETFSVHLGADNSAPLSTHVETSVRVVINQHRSLIREEDRILPEDVFLLIPEVKDNMKKDSQTRRGPRDYLVLNQSLFDFPNSDCFNEKTRFLSLLVPQHRPCVEAYSVDLEKQPYDFYVKAKVKEIRNRSTEFFLSSFGTLYNPATISRHRSSVIFISQQPLILHIFIPNEEASSRLRVPEFLSTVFGTISLYSRHFGSFLTDQWTPVTATSGYGYDVITQHLQLLVNFVKRQWTSAVDVPYTAAEQLRDILVSFDNLDRISLEKSIDYQWNLIWSCIDHVCHKIGVLRADGDATIAAGWIAFFDSFLNDQCSLIMTTIRDAYDIISEYFDTVYSLHLGTFFKDQFTLVLAIIHEGYDVIAQNLQLLASFLKVQWSSAVRVLYSAAEQLSFDKLDRISLEKSIDYQWNLIGSYIDHACHKIGVLRAEGDVKVAAGWIAFSLLIVFPVLLVKWLVTSLRNGADVEDMDDIIMLDNDNGIPVLDRDDPLVEFLRKAFSIMYLPQWDDEDNNMVDGTNRAIVGQNTVLRPFTDPIVAMGIGYSDDEIIFPRLTVSDSYINYGFVTARSNDYHEVLLANRARSDCVVMYLPQRRTEFRCTNISRDLSLVTLVANEGRNRLPTRRFFSLPCITALERYQCDNDYALTERIGSSSDLMSVTNREAKTRVLEPPNMVSRKDKDFKQVMKEFLTDIDDTYGPPSEPATHLLREEMSEQDEERDPTDAHKIYMAPKSNSPKVSRKDKDFKQVMKEFLTDIDDTYGPPSEPATHLLREEMFAKDEERDPAKALKIYMAPKSNSPKVSRKDKDFKQVMKEFLTDIDDTYGPPSEPATHLVRKELSEQDAERDVEEREEISGSIDLVEAYKIHIAKKGVAIKMSPQNEDFQQALKDALADIDETYGSIKTPRRRLTNVLWGCQEIIFYVLRVYRDKQIL